MNCRECGSGSIGYDPDHGSKYCRECGFVIEEPHWGTLVPIDID